MRKDRRGGYLDAMKMVLMIPTFILVAFGIGVLVYGVTNDKLDTAQFDSLYIDTYTSQLLNTPQCLAYQDPQTKRVDYGVLDEQKLTQKRLGACLTYGEPRRQFPARMEITNRETGVKTTLNSSSWYAGINIKKTMGEEVTLLVNGEAQRAVVKLSYGNPRMLP